MKGRKLSALAAGWVVLSFAEVKKVVEKGMAGFLFFFKETAISALHILN